MKTKKLVFLAMLACVLAFVFISCEGVSDAHGGTVTPPPPAATYILKSGKITAPTAANLPTSAEWLILTRESDDARYGTGAARVAAAYSGITWDATATTATGQSLEAVQNTLPAAKNRITASTEQFIVIDKSGSDPMAYYVVRQ